MQTNVFELPILNLVGGVATKDNAARTLTCMYKSGVSVGI